MIRYKSQKPLTLKGFDTPLDIILDLENRWVKLNDCIPWAELAENYYKTLEQIRRNPYLQYFIGLKGFRLEAAFAPSLLINVRKCMG
ncbi:hypothetical protein SAMN05428977_102326 [Nitrosomonas sp. Nm166]|nr:hypothetical protein SAMN05428977_102326 [Nitrosomonas sp. Nm166]